MPDPRPLSVAAARDLYCRALAWSADDYDTSDWETIAAVVNSILAATDIEEATRVIMASVPEWDNPGECAQEIRRAAGMYETQSKPRTGKELLQALTDSGFVGMWADHDDIGDSAEFARRLRTGDGLSPADFDRLVAWFRDPARRPAHLVFTAGAARDAATAWEVAQRQEQDTTTKLE